MATAFEQRERAFENKFFHDQDMLFKVISRRRKLLGLWAGLQMHLSDPDAKAYALEIVKYGIEDNAEGAVVRRIVNDLNASGIETSEEDVRDQMDEFHEQASNAILHGMN